jgi:hypothetical protein
MLSENKGTIPAAATFANSDLFHGMIEQRAGTSSHKSFYGTEITPAVKETKPENMYPVK